MRALALGLLLLGLVGCGARPFVCSDDVACGAVGRCEASGWCSFPDDGCPSGRRFGDLSGDGLAGTCVGLVDDSSTGEPSEQASSTGGDDSSGSTESSAGDPPIPGDGSSTTSLGGCENGGCTTTTSASSETGRGESAGDSGEPERDPCSGWTDDFEDGVFDAGWSVEGVAGEGHVLQEVDGELRWELGVGYTGSIGLWRSLDAMAGAVRIELGESPY